jgi:hypothetical protein
MEIRRFGRRWWRSVFRDVMLGGCLAALVAGLGRFWIRQEQWWIATAGTLVPGRIIASAPREEPPHTADVVIEYKSLLGRTCRIQEIWPEGAEDGEIGRAVGVYVWDRNIIVRAMSSRHPGILTALDSKRAAQEARRAGTQSMIDRRMLNQLDPQVLERLKRLRSSR